MIQPARHDVVDAIADYFAARTQGPWAVSTRRAMARVRALRPDARISDEELTRMIADYAITRGFTIAFDGSEGSNDPHVDEPGAHG
ncbi:MAG: hypothetical protein K5872_04965 [Rhizobiaceae bacterium]|nr:hypothetical protein [Rhizobiaceae bacterium]MCV0405560.1 hypothetical protein [Rhizobiaceae bacterium]